MFRATILTFSGSSQYVARKGKEEEFVEIAPGLNAELDENGRVIGIEILNASSVLKSIAKPLYKHMQLA